MKVYMTRHGETNYNLKNLCNYTPSADVHLTERGKEQAKKLKMNLIGKKIDAVYISELPRTRQTFELLDLDLKPIVDKRLNDINVGIFESKPVSEFHDYIKNDLFRTQPPGGETWQEQKKRIFEFLEEIKSKKFKSVLIIAHNDTCKIVTAYFNKLSDKEMWKIETNNCGLLNFEF